MKEITATMNNIIPEGEGYNTPFGMKVIDRFFAPYYTNEYFEEVICDQKEFDELTESFM